jgi:hypothetical protein
MLCKKYDELSYFDKVTYIGELLHACQSDDLLFDEGNILITKAKSMGLFNGVVILPDHIKTENNSDNI